jgi:hypothetical protein
MYHAGHIDHTSCSCRSVTALVRLVDVVTSMRSSFSRDSSRRSTPKVQGGGSLAGNVSISASSICSSEITLLALAKRCSQSSGFAQLKFVNPALNDARHFSVALALGLSFNADGLIIRDIVPSLFYYSYLRFHKSRDSPPLRRSFFTRPCQCSAKTIGIKIRAIHRRAWLLLPGVIKPACVNCIKSKFVN